MMLTLVVCGWLAHTPQTLGDIFTAAFVYVKSAALPQRLGQPASLLDGNWPWASDLRDRINLAHIESRRGPWHLEMIVPGLFRSGSPGIAQVLAENGRVFVVLRQEVVTSGGACGACQPAVVAQALHFVVVCLLLHLLHMLLLLIPSSLSHCSRVRNLKSARARMLKLLHLVMIGVISPPSLVIGLTEMKRVSRLQTCFLPAYPLTLLFLLILLVYIVELQGRHCTALLLSVGIVLVEPIFEVFGTLHLLHRCVVLLPMMSTEIVNLAHFKTPSQYVLVLSSFLALPVHLLLMGPIEVFRRPNNFLVKGWRVNDLNTTLLLAAFKLHLLQFLLLRLVHHMGLLFDVLHTWEAGPTRRHF